MPLGCLAESSERAQHLRCMRYVCHAYVPCFTKVCISPRLLELRQTYAAGAAAT